jgi:hypothetical protein
MLPFAIVLTQPFKQPLRSKKRTFVLTIGSKAHVKAFDRDLNT